MTTTSQAVPTIKPEATQPPAPAPVVASRGSDLVGKQDVYLHIGAPKTGTTFLQGVLWSNRNALTERGVYVPGDHPVDHICAANDLRGVPEQPEHPSLGSTGSWDRFVREISASDADTVIVSDERLAACSTEQAARAVASLKSANVHVILTLRDFFRILPAEWQEHVKHGDRRAFDDWLAEMLGRRGEQWFWQLHGALGILHRWGDAVAPERLHIITVPSSQPPPELLWERFASVIGIEAGDLDINVHGNVSLGAEGTEFIRRVNESLPADFPFWHQAEFVRDTLAHRAIYAPTKRTPVNVSAEWSEWVNEYNQALLKELRTSRSPITGNLDELVPDKKDTATIADPQTLDLTAAGLQSTTELILRVSDMRDENRQMSEELKELRGRLAAQHGAAERTREAITRERQELSPTERIKRTVVELGGQLRSVSAALRLWRWAKRRRAAAGKQPARPDQ